MCSCVFLHAKANTEKHMMRRKRGERKCLDWNPCICFLSVSSMSDMWNEQMLCGKLIKARKFRFVKLRACVMCSIRNWNEDNSFTRGSSLAWSKHRLASPKTLDDGWIDSHCNKESAKNIKYACTVTGKIIRITIKL